jgi:hypothetical protein
MSATPRSARLSSPGEVVAILVATAAAWVVLIVLLFVALFTVLIPTLQYGGRGEIPNDFPVYPGAQMGSAYGVSAGGCTSVQATWSTSDGADAVQSFYEARLSSGDWTITSTSNGRIDFKGTSGPQRTGTIYIRANEFAHETVIDLVLTMSPARSNVRCLSGSSG